MTRNTATRDRHRKRIARDQPPCTICGRPIDYALPWRHPESFQVDHIVPLNKGGTDTPENTAASHRACNRAKSDTLPVGAVRRFVTDRSW